MDELQRNRLFAGGALLLVLFGGYSFSSSYAGATEEQVQAVMAKRVTRGDQQSKVLARGKRFENTPEHFTFELSEDLKRFALREVTVEEAEEWWKKSTRPAKVSKVSEKEQQIVEAYYAAKQEIGL